MTKVSVKVLLFATLRSKYKTRELTVACNGTLLDMIESAAKLLGSEFIYDVYDRKRGRARDDMIIMVNGRNIKDLEGELTLKDNEVVAIFPPLARG